VNGSAAAVIGGGTLGLETAVQLAALGLAVTLVHPRPTLLDQHLDEVAGRLVRRALERHGITVLTAQVISVDTVGREPAGPGAERVVRCADGHELVVDHVVFTTGARPRVDLAERSGLRVGRGVQVDDRLRTSAAGVHAIGDCVEHRGTVYGTAAPGLEQARVLAALLTGADSDARYRGSREWTRVVAGGLDVLALGASTTISRMSPDVAAEPIAAGGDDVLEILQERRGVYRKVVTRDGRLAGAIVVGDPDLVPRLGRIFDRGGQVPANVLDLFASWSGDAGAFEVDPEVCRCRRVGEAKLRAALAAGCTTVESLMEDTGAGQVCGACLPVLSRLAADAGKGDTVDQLRSA
jgi:nitrite reductase (NADH) large subunit